YRSTISDVIGGSLARLYLAEKFGTVILSSICQVGELKAQRTLAQHVAELAGAAGRLDPTSIAAIETDLASAEIHSIDANFAAAAGDLIKATRIDGDSLGAAVEVVAVNVPPLAGDPL